MTRYMYIQRPTHGTGIIPIHRRRTPWWGGIFGQPYLPHGRTGNFKARWALPPEFANDDEGIFYPKTFLPIPGTAMDEPPPKGYDRAILTEGINTFRYLRARQQKPMTAQEVVDKTASIAQRLMPSRLKRPAATAAALVLDRRRARGELPLRPSLKEQAEQVVDEAAQITEVAANGAYSFARRNWKWLLGSAAAYALLR